MLNAPEVTKVNESSRFFTRHGSMLNNVEESWEASIKICCWWNLSTNNQLTTFDVFSFNPICLFWNGSFFILIYCRVKICWNKLTVNFLLSLAWIKIVQFPLIIWLFDLWRAVKIFLFTEKSDFVRRKFKALLQFFHGRRSIRNASDLC